MREHCTTICAVLDAQITNAIVKTKGVLFHDFSGEGDQPYSHQRIVHTNSEARHLKPLPEDGPFSYQCIISNFKPPKLLPEDRPFSYQYIISNFKPPN